MLRLGVLVTTAYGSFLANSMQTFDLFDELLRFALSF
jgi:hypothetical protein